MTQTITRTGFNFPLQKSIYHGKVRDVYNIDDRLLVMVVTDRISAFDVVLPKGIPFKGQVLNQVALKFLDATTDIVPNWKISVPDPMVMIGHFAKPFRVEMVIRGYLSGHAWREYKAGKRVVCGVPMPDGMVENQKFPDPIITPTTKAETGHDLDISRNEIIERGLVSEHDYSFLEEYTVRLFERGTRMAAEKGLILVDTKYEFGEKDGKIYLIDEINTPDSSRYFYAEGYEERLRNGEPQKQLSKEFVRQWLIKNNFQGKPGQIVPDIPDALVQQISERYIELYEKITGERFQRFETGNLMKRIERNTRDQLKKML
ncbi:MAG: phosphoribosylaminoimidazolesuccinocarboxamide synthase [Bacteroidales bacterium]|nr:phosphoribosylaminoimidazolesuccinocarboxamide synthase [Bacteroidales bacterium]